MSNMASPNVAEDIGIGDENLETGSNATVKEQKDEGTVVTPKNIEELKQSSPIEDDLKHDDLQGATLPENPEQGTGKNTSQTLDKSFIITEDNIEHKIEKLDEFIEGIERRVKAFSDPAELKESFAKQDIKFYVSSPQVAYRVADRLNRISKLVKNNKLGDQIKLNNLLTKQGCEEDVRNAFLIGIEKHNTIQVPIFKDDTKKGTETALQKAEKWLSNLNKVLEIRSTTGFKENSFSNKPLNVKLPDGLHTTPEVAKFLKEELSAIITGDAGAIKLDTRQTKIDDPKSGFRDYYIRKKDHIVLDDNVSAEEAISKMDSIKEKLSPDYKYKIRLVISESLLKIKEVYNSFLNLKKTHQDNIALEPGYAVDSLEAFRVRSKKEEPAAPETEKVSLKSSTSTASTGLPFEDLDPSIFEELKA